jgi:hypothetical protein
MAQWSRAAACYEPEGGNVAVYVGGRETRKVTRAAQQVDNKAQPISKRLAKWSHHVTSSDRHARGEALA